MGEFQFIDNIKNLFSSLPTNGFEGIGDDCAVLPISEHDSLLFTSDMLVEGVHFMRDTISAFDLGVKSLAVNLSDIASSGGAPVATLLSISLPKGVDSVWSSEFMRGYHSLSQRHNVALVGGDTTSSTEQITINVTAIGRVKNIHIKRRSAARVGDIIMVSGSLGDSAAGLKALMDGDVNNRYVSSHLLPTPRIEEALWLSKQSAVHAMMDISDGVASDVRHIMSSSKVGARINLEALPTDHDFERALCGGEDYELMFTVDSSRAEALVRDFKDMFATQITTIGEIVESNSIEWMLHGTRQTIDFMGFRHF